MKKITLVFVIIGILALSAYVYVRHSLDTPGFHPAPPQSGMPVPKAAQSPLDIRPKLINKLQQLVHDGSGGLYQLSIREIEPDVVASAVSLKDISLRPDSSVLQQLKASGRLPKDVFAFSLGALRIEGIAMKDLLEKDAIDLKTLSLLSPTIEIYHNKSAGTPSKDQGTLYQRIRQQLRHLSINDLSIHKGTVISHQGSQKKPTRFNEVEIHLSNLLMDSTTQNDRRRFLFAKQARLSTQNFSRPTADNLYDIRIGGIAIQEPAGQMVLSNLALQPRFSKQEFERHLRVMTERYDLAIPTIELKNADWWTWLNEGVLQAPEADLKGGHFSVYLDRSLPEGPPEVANFPQQLLMRMPLPLRIGQLHMGPLQLSYEEYSPTSGKAGTLYFKGLVGTITNLTNMPAAIKKNSHTTVAATGDFLGSIKARLTLDFNMARYKAGAFTAGLSTGSFDGTVVNPVAEPLGLFEIKRGAVQELTARVSGNNHEASGQVLLRYDHLHVVPLKKANEEGQMGKKRVTSFIANTFVLKNDNPSGSQPPRQPEAHFVRDPHSSFFNLIWKTTFVGILKTIGAPERLATQ